MKALNYRSSLSPQANFVSHYAHSVADPGRKRRLFEKGAAQISTDYLHWFVRDLTVILTANYTSRVQLLPRSCRLHCHSNAQADREGWWTRDIAEYSFPVRPRPDRKSYAYYTHEWPKRPAWPARYEHRQCLPDRNAGLTFKALQTAP